MALQAYIVVFTNTEPTNRETLPTQPDILEAFKEYMGIPDDDNDLEVEMWAVDIESVGYDSGQCRKCGKECNDDRLFCDDCNAVIAKSKDSRDKS